MEKSQEFVPQVLKQVVNLSCYLWNIGQQSFNLTEVFPLKLNFEGQYSLLLQYEILEKLVTFILPSILFSFLYLLDNGSQIPHSLEPNMFWRFWAEFCHRLSGQDKVGVFRIRQGSYTNSEKEQMKVGKSHKGIETEKGCNMIGRMSNALGLSPESRGPIVKNVIAKFSNDKSCTPNPESGAPIV